MSYFQIDTTTAPPPLGSMEFLQGDSGGAVGPTAGGLTNVVGGTGVNIVGNPGTNTLTVNSVGTTLTWSTENGVSANLVIDTGVFATNVALTTFTLPVTAAVGDTIFVTGISAGLWKIAQNATQNIRFGNRVSTIGITGSYTSTSIGDGVGFVCYVANTSFLVIHSVGDFAIV